MYNSRKTIRLPSANYLGLQAYFVTICCDLRRPHLAQYAVANRAATVLHECAARQNFQLHAEGTTPQSNLREFVRVFKLRTSFEFRQSHNVPLWEMSYYDHILRRF